MTKRSVKAAPAPMTPERIEAARELAAHFVHVLTVAPESREAARFVAFLEADRLKLQRLDVRPKDLPTRRMLRAIRFLDKVRAILDGGRPQARSREERAQDFAEVYAAQESRVGRADALTGIPVAAWLTAFRSWRGIDPKRGRPRKGWPPPWSAVLLALLQAGRCPNEKRLTGETSHENLARAWRRHEASAVD
jgi:hypothetical protein